MTFDTAIFLIDDGFMAALCAVLAGKRIYRASPVFFAYVSYNLASGVAGQLVVRYLPGWHLRFTLLVVLVAVSLEFCAMVEIGRHLLRSNRAEPPSRRVIVFLGGWIALFVFLLAGWAFPTGRAPLSAFYYFLIRADEILEFAWFLTLLLWSKLEGLRWPERDLRVATGLGIISCTFYLIAVLHARFATGPMYHLVDQAGEATLVAVDVYWLHYFWIKADREPAASAARVESDLGRDGNGDDRRQRRGAAKIGPKIGPKIVQSPIYYDDQG